MRKVQIETNRTDRTVLPRGAARNGKACSCVGDETGTNFLSGCANSLTRSGTRYHVSKGDRQSIKDKRGEEKERGFVVRRGRWRAIDRSQQRRDVHVSRDVPPTRESRETRILSFERRVGRDSPPRLTPRAAARGREEGWGAEEGVGWTGARNNSPKNICRVERVSDRWQYYTDTSQLRCA